MMRRIVFWLGIVLAASAALAVTFIGARWVAGEEYRSAYNALQSATERYTSATGQIDSAISAAETITNNAASVLAHPRVTALSEHTQPLDAATEALQGALAVAQADHTVIAIPAIAPPPSFVDNPWPWAVKGTAEDITELARELNRDSVEEETESTKLNELRATVDGHGEALFESIEAQARQLLEENTQASYRTKFALEDALASVDSATPSGRTSAVLDELRTAEEAVTESQRVKSEQSADPRLADRRVIEEYARSISNGLLLDFEWAASVAGVGSDYLSGTTEWDMTYRSALITLNFTIEDGWSDPLNAYDAKALVAHEVGHAQMLRESCRALFERPEFADDQEAWATAWSIGMGFDTGGSGIEAYGRPTAQQIAIAKECR